LGVLPKKAEHIQLSSQERIELKFPVAKGNSSAPPSRGTLLEAAASILHNDGGTIDDLKNDATELQTSSPRSLRRHRKQPAASLIANAAHPRLASLPGLQRLFPIQS
jgi:hypothetical protein